MISEIHLRCLLEPLGYNYHVYLCTGEQVTISYDFTTKRLVDGRFVNTLQHSLLSPLKPGDHYIIEVSNVAIRFDFTKEHLTDPLGSTYFYYKHLAKLGLVSIRPRKLLQPNTFEKNYVDIVCQRVWVQYGNSYLFVWNLLQGCISLLIQDGREASAIVLLINVFINVLFTCLILGIAYRLLGLLVPSLVTFGSHLTPSIICKSWSKNQ